MNIGFLLLTVNQTKEHAQILQAINGLCAIRPQDNIVLFNNYFEAVDTDQKYYTLSINHAKYFKGHLFVFDTQSAMLVSGFPAQDKQILHMSELEWYGQQSPYTTWHNIYMQERLDIITNTKENYDIIDICWKKPKALIEALDGESLNRILQG